MRDAKPGHESDTVTERTHRPRVSVLAGFSTSATVAVARDMLTTNPDLVLVQHDLAGIRDGRVHRLVSTGREIVESEVIGLAHGCVSCTLREDVLPTLVRLARIRPDQDIVLVLPDVVEPETVAAAAQACTVDGAPVMQWIRFGTFVTVVDASTFLADAMSDDDLSDRGRQAADDDTRSVAEVVFRQIEYADEILVRNASDTHGLEHELLAALAPWASAGESRDRDMTTPPALLRGLEGLPTRQLRELDHGVRTVGFSSRRPLHPERFDAALRHLSDGCLRCRGHLWIASQPDLVLAFESAGGGVSMGAAGKWLAAVEPEEWEMASPARRTAASLDWDDYYGDRGIDLVFTGVGRDVTDLPALLESCLLTDEELSSGFDSWADLTDPFAGCFDD